MPEIILLVLQGRDGRVWAQKMDKHCRKNLINIHVLDIWVHIDPKNGINIAGKKILVLHGRDGRIHIDMHVVQDKTF